MYWFVYNRSNVHNDDKDADESNDYIDDNKCVLVCFIP